MTGDERRDVTHVKICGVTTVEDARLCAELGASAIGLNFVPSSPRRIGVDAARTIATALAGTKVVVVGVVADLDVTAIEELVRRAGLGCVQLHGDEPPERLAPLLPHAYKAVRIAGPEDVALARTFPGDHLLVDAKVEGALGGSGHSFDWQLVVDLAKERKLTLAGGLRPDNVSAAIQAIRPYCVDVASGVESAPGRKDRALVEAFVAAVRAASADAG